MSSPASPEEERKRAGRERARAIAREYLARGDGTGWFEAFYRDAGGNPERVPWADRAGHPLLAEWLAGVRGGGRSALVVGCGLGEDAELVARAGFQVTGFDLSATAIAMCKQLWPGTRVRYLVADLLAPPREWLAAFELVVEIYTVQALPPDLRERAIAGLADLVARGGTLLVVTMGRGDDQPPEELPWPLSPAELARFEDHGLSRVGFRELLEADPGGPPDGPVVPRWRAEFLRPA